MANSFLAGVRPFVTPRPRSRFLRAARRLLGIAIVVLGALTLVAGFAAFASSSAAALDPMASGICTSDPAPRISP